MHKKSCKSSSISKLFKRKKNEGKEKLVPYKSFQIQISLNFKYVFIFNNKYTEKP